MIVYNGISLVSPFKSYMYNLKYVRYNIIILLSLKLVHFISFHLLIEIHLSYNKTPQGDGRTYSYVAGLSSTSPIIDWPVLMYFSKMIPRICHNVNRVVYIFGDAVKDPLQVCRTSGFPIINMVLLKYRCQEKATGETDHFNKY